MRNPLSNEALNQIFVDARTHYNWQPDTEISNELLAQIYDLAKLGPTSANCSPLRIVFVKSKAEKEKLRLCLDAGNIDKTMSAPVTAIFGHDMVFYDNLPKLFPYADARPWFTGNEEKIFNTAFRNSALQAAYFIIAARSLGIDCGPMSGFNNKMVDDNFFKGTSILSNFLCNLGYGQIEKLYPRLPRLDFIEACKII